MLNSATGAETPAGAPGSRAVASLPPRAAVIRAELDLARRQLEGYTRLIRHQGDVLGEEVEPPADGPAREALLGEIDRLERHLAALSTPVVMPDLVLGGSPRAALTGAPDASVGDLSGARR